MLIFVNIEEKNVIFMIIYVNLCKYRRQTDNLTHQKYSSEPHKRFLFPYFQN